MKYTATVRFKDPETDKWQKNEMWLVNEAVSITDAESQIYADIQQIGSVTEWEIRKIEQSRISKIVGLD